MASPSRFCSRFTHWNARGLRANLPEFLHFLSESSPSCTFICESFLQDQHRLSVPGHVVHRQNATAQASGGFACVVSNSFSSHLVPIPLPSLPSFCTAFRASLSSCSLTIFSVYLRPQSCLQEIDLLETLVASFPPPYLLLGDFNAHHPSWGSARSCQRGLRLVSLLDSLNLVSLNSSSPTRFDAHSGTFSHLDLAFISPSLACWEVHLDSLGSNHFPCTVSLFDRPPPSAQSPLAGFCIKLTGSFSLPLLTLPSPPPPPLTLVLLTVFMMLFALPSSPVLMSPSPALALALPSDPLLLGGVMPAVLLSAPSAEPIGNSDVPARRPTWIPTAACVPSPVGWYVRPRGTPGGSSAAPSPGTPLSPFSGDVSIALPSIALIPMAFFPPSPWRKKPWLSSPTLALLPSPSDHFASVSAHVSDLVLPCPCSTVLCLPFTLSELDRAIALLKDTAPGEDNISAALLKHLPLSARLSLLHLFNRSQASRLTSLLTPSSFRPIALTSVPCKTMEKLVLTRLHWFLETSGLLSPSSWASVLGAPPSTVSSGLEADIRSSFRAKHHTLAYFLDISQVFHTFWHDGLLLKLSRLHLPLCLICWIHSFLSHHSAKIKLGSFTSDSSTCSGTPQGSVLSPTLFNLMVNDLPDILPPQVRTSIYADDIVIWTCGKSLPLLGHRLQDALDSISDWADEWRFTFCASKSCVIPLSRSHSPTNLSLLINSSPIPNSSSTWHLGLLFDRLLSWTSHFQFLRSSCQQHINLMRLVSGSDWEADRDSLLLLYKTLVRPLLDFGCPLFLDAASSSLQILEVIQARCLRVAAGLPPSTPHSTLCAEMGIMPITVRHRLLSFNFLTRILDRCPSSPVATLFSLLSPDVGPLRRHCTPALVLASRLVSPLSAPPDCSPLPLWIFPEPLIYLPPPCTRSHLPPPALKAAFLEVLHSRFDHCFHIFSDGSFVSDTGFTSSSFWDPAHSFAFSQRLPDHLGIFAAELFAIFPAPPSRSFQAAHSGGHFF